LSDASEVLSVTISNIPSGAVLSVGTLNQDGSVNRDRHRRTGLRCDGWRVPLDPVGRGVERGL
jgi:hypothetical protein